MDITHHPTPTVPAADPPPDHFLRLMFFQASDRLGAKSSAKSAAPPASRFASLPQARLRSSAAYYLPETDHVVIRVNAASPAVDVMTDLHRVAPATIGRLATVEEANRAMIARGVRALFVVDQRRILGILTATDILGEKPVQVGHTLGIHHDEVMVRDVMTPADQIEVIDFASVLDARVGDVVATLKRAGRQHALVSDLQEASNQQSIRGIFSLTQIARQLGLESVGTDINRTFADIEATMAGG